MDDDKGETLLANDGKRKCLPEKEIYFGRILGKKKILLVNWEMLDVIHGCWEMLKYISGYWEKLNIIGVC